MIAITDKTRIFVSSIFILAIFLSSCSKQTPSKNNTSTKANGLVFALASGESYICSYRNENDKSRSEHLVKGKSYRLNLLPEASPQQSAIIMNEKGLYMWTLGETEGFFYSTAKENDKNKAIDKLPTTGFDDYLNPKKLDEKEKIDCKKAPANNPISDSVFTPPAEVSFFDDFTKMSESSTNSSKRGTTEVNPIEP